MTRLTRVMWHLLLQASTSSKVWVAVLLLLLLRLERPAGARPMSSYIAAAAKHTRAARVQAQEWGMMAAARRLKEG